MSRIGKIPIKLPKNVHSSYNDTILIIKGEFGILKKQIPNMFNIRYENNIIYLDLKNYNIRKIGALYGLYRTLIFNMVIGVSEQFELALKLNGVGYKAYIEKNILILNLGYSHLIKKIIPNDIFVKVLKNTNIVIKSCEKEKLGLFVSQLRSCRPPEPYKGKGILFENEIIKYKKGKLNKK